MFFALLLLVGLSSASDQFWVTTVITEFRVRDQCSSFWNSSAVCSTPLLRISTDVNKPSQYASRAWPLDAVLPSTDRPSFISQWHGSIESVRVSAQIEGSNKLNPFGLVPKCDEGFHPRIAFNHSSLDVMERLSIRVIVIESHCFSVKVLVKVDTACPYCPPPTTTTLATNITAEPVISRRVLLLVLTILIVLTGLIAFVFCVVLIRCLRRRSAFKPCPSLESGIYSVSTDSTCVSTEKRDIFSIMPPIIDFEELDLDESVDIESIPRLGSLSYNFYNDALNVSVSDPVFV